MNLENLQSKITSAQEKANDITTQDGASIWLSPLPLKDERLLLTKCECFG